MVVSLFDPEFPAWWLNAPSGTQALPKKHVEVPQIASVDKVVDVPTHHKHHKGKNDHVKVAETHHQTTKIEKSHKSSQKSLQTPVQTVVNATKAKPVTSASSEEDIVSLPEDDVPEWDPNWDFIGPSESEIASLRELCKERPTQSSASEVASEGALEKILEKLVSIE